MQIFINHQLAAIKRDSTFDFVTELPKTISGKIRRATIREKDKQDQQKSDAEKAN